MSLPSSQHVLDMPDDPNPTFHGHAVRICPVARVLMKLGAKQVLCGHVVALVLMLWLAIFIWKFLIDSGIIQDAGGGAPPATP